MNCPRCDEELRENARFCSGCGLSSASFNTLDKPAHAEAEARVDPLLDQTLDGKYFLLKRLGVGGMGVVYRARRIHIGDEVALKVLHRKLVTGAAMLERFLPSVAKNSRWCAAVRGSALRRACVRLSERSMYPASANSAPGFEWSPSRGLCSLCTS